MAFKLTAVLCLFIFVAFYFAPDPEPRVATVTEPVRAPVPAPSTLPPDSPATGSVTEASPAETAPEQVPAPAQEPEVADVPNISADTDAAVAEALAAEQDPSATVPSPLTLGTLSLGEDGATAMSLAESVRSRTETARQDFATTTLGSNRNSAAPSPAPSPTLGVTEAALPEARINATSVNLRAGPSTSQDVVGRASLGEIVEIVEDGAAPGWSAIRTSDGNRTVYISSQFLDPLD